MTNYEEKDEVFKGNYYIEHFNSCFDILNIEDRINHITLSNPGYTEKLNFFDKIRGFKPREYPPEFHESKNTFVEAFDDRIDEFVKQDFEPTNKEGKNVVRSFEQMWYFAQFVRYAEKVIFYKNDTDKPLYVDSSLDEEHERLFVIKKEDYEVKFKVQWLYDTTAKHMMKVINIKIDRFFGKEMSNEYIIVDENIKLNDASDFVLITIINNVLYDATLETYKAIMNTLFTFFEDRMLFPRPE